MRKVTTLAFLAAVGFGTISAQQPARTPWHVSKISTFTYTGVAGSGIATGNKIATVPSGYSAVIEQVSAICIAPPAMTIALGEIIVSASPRDPGQTGKEEQENSAYHALVFQKSPSGTDDFYIASQRMTLRVGAPKGAVDFAGSFLKTGDQASVSMSCIFSISGYMEKQ